MSLTTLARLTFEPRQRELARQAHDGDAAQREVIRWLTHKAKDTEYGRTHAFAAVRSYEDFADSVPVNTYEELKESIDRMRHGESDVLWPG